MFGISSAEFAVILVIALLIVGPKQMPDVLRALGRLYRNLNQFIRKSSQLIDDIMYDADKIAAKAEKALLSEQKKTSDLNKEKQPEKKEASDDK
ncbi:MAG: twin-arginine translocase TatA/TatE family subunit [Alphaproteobacteria bacterium]|nr:twin-arginine translocase TatA/TatE family subunit [Alphaproteobacteria bacterium]